MIPTPLPHMCELPSGVIKDVFYAIVRRVEACSCHQCL